MDAEQGSGKQKSPQKSPEKSPAKEKSPEKVVEEESETQEEWKEGVKEPIAKRKKSIPRKTTRKRQKLEEDAEKDELKGFLDIVPREEAPIEISKGREQYFCTRRFESHALGEIYIFCLSCEDDEILDKINMSIISRLENM
ncbi:hypothetical protein Tco_0045664 [Tanacetum coccineum]